MIAQCHLYCNKIQISLLFTLNKSTKYNSYITQIQSNKSEYEILVQILLWARYK